MGGLHIIPLTVPIIRWDAASPRVYRGEGGQDFWSLAGVVRQEATREREGLLIEGHPFLFIIMLLCQILLHKK